MQVKYTARLEHEEDLDGLLVANSAHTAQSEMHETRVDQKPSPGSQKPGSGDEILQLQNYVDQRNPQRAPHDEDDAELR